MKNMQNHCAVARNQGLPKMQNAWFRDGFGVEFGGILETFGRHVGVILGTLEGYFFDGFWGTPGIQKREKVEGDEESLEALSLQ